MKLHQLTKKHELNFHNFKDHLKKLGYVGYGSPAKIIPDSDLEKLEEIAAEFVEQQKILNSEKVERRKGRMIGAVYDRKAGDFVSVVVKASYRDLVEKGVEFEILDRHSSIFGAMLKIANNLKKYVNNVTVQKYGKMEE